METSVKLAIEIVGTVGGILTGFLVLYWRIAVLVTTWRKDLEMAQKQIGTLARKEDLELAQKQIETLDEKIDELIVQVALASHTTEVKHEKHFR